MRCFITSGPVLIFQNWNSILHLILVCLSRGMTMNLPYETDRDFTWTCKMKRALVKTTRVPVYAKCCTELEENDGWMNCDFTSFSTVFQSYQEVDKERLCAMKLRLRLRRFRLERTRSARSVGQRLTHWATGAPLVINQFSNFTICFLCVKNSEDPHLHWYVTILIYCDKKAFGQKYYVYDLDKTTDRYLDEFVLKHKEVTS